MFLLNPKEQIEFRILIVSIIVISIIYKFISPEKVFLKDIVLNGKNQIAISLNSENNQIEVTEVKQTRKLAPYKVIINNATLEDLLSCPGIGQKKAKQIIKERQIRPFYDWRDLQDRIKGISKTQIEILKNAGVNINIQDKVIDL